MIKLPDTDGLQDRVRLSEQTGPGPRLRAAREASGYEIEDIAKQLRLHPEILMDLEKDTFADHLALVFVRGYLRAYANIIGLNPEQVVEEFNALGYQEDRALPDLKGKPKAASRMRTEHEMQSPTMSPRFKWVAITLVIIALGGVFAAYNYEPQETLPPAQISPEVMQETPVDSASTDLPEPPAATQNSVRMGTTPAANTPSVTSSPTRPTVTATPAVTQEQPVIRSNSSDDGSDDPEVQLPRPGARD